MPETWASDASRRDKAHIGDEVRFLTKPEIALELIRDALEQGIPKRPVLADAAFGDNREFREALLELGLDFAVGVSSNTTVWGPSVEPVPKQRQHKVGRPPSRYIGTNGEQPVRVMDIARCLQKAGAFRKTTWRQGSKSALSAKFARVWVRSAEKCTKGVPPSEPMWLLIEMTSLESRPFKFYFSSLSEKTPMKVLVDLIKMRWRIEMDYRDMKQHLGLDQYEGRTWSGFHTHFCMVVLMHTFIALHPERFSPRSTVPMELESVL